MARYTAFLNPDLNAIADSIQPASPVQNTTDNILDTNAVELLPTPQADKKNYITTLVITNADASVGTWVHIYEEDSPLVILFRVFCAPNGGGASVPFGTNPLASPNFGKKLFIKAETTGAEIGATAIGFQQ